MLVKEEKKRKELALELGIGLNKLMIHLQMHIFGYENPCYISR